MKNFFGNAGVGVAIGLLAAGLLDCAGAPELQQHPFLSQTEKGRGAESYRTLAALAFSTRVSDKDDPDRIAPAMATTKFYALLQKEKDYDWVAAVEVEGRIKAEGLTHKLDEFYKDWISDFEDVDKELIRQVAALTRADAVVAGAVEVWKQKELGEDGVVRTRVGLQVGLFDGQTGKRLWTGRDDNFIEARHSDFAEAMDRVVQSLVRAFPASGRVGR